MDLLSANIPAPVSQAYLFAPRGCDGPLSKPGRARCCCACRQQEARSNLPSDGCSELFHAKQILIYCFYSLRSNSPALVARPARP